MKQVKWRALLAAFGLGAVLVAAQPAAPVLAQNINLMPGVKTLTPEEREQQRKIEDAYKAKLRTIPDAQISNDPWGNVRGQGAKPNARSDTRQQAKPQAASGSRPAARQSQGAAGGPMRLHQ